MFSWPILMRIGLQSSAVFVAPLGAIVGWQPEGRGCHNDGRETRQSHSNEVREPEKASSHRHYVYRNQTIKIYS